MRPDGASWLRNITHGSEEHGKLQTHQLKHYYLSIISRIDEMQEFHDYADGLQWFMETNPDPEIAIRFLKDRCCIQFNFDIYFFPTWPFFA